MKWPTWEQAAIAALASAIVAVVVRRRRPGRLPHVAAAATEFAIISGLYSVWRIARKLPLSHEDGAIERARWIVDLQDALLFPSELTVQEFVLRFEWLARFTSLYYGILHVPALVAFLVWLFVRHRDHYPHWRNGLAFLTGACLVIRWVRVAPPRFLTDLGYVDISEIYGPSIYGPVGTGVSDQFAAMPSIHVGWAAVVSLGIFATTTSRWRWFFLAHLIVTAIVVSASGHHWWLDGIVAVGLLAIGLRLDTAIRRRRSHAATGDDPIETAAPPRHRRDQGVGSSSTS